MRLLILGYIKLAYSYTNKNKDISLSVEGAEACLISNAVFLIQKSYQLKIFLFMPIKQAGLIVFFQRADGL